MPEMISDNGFPRRIRADLYTPAEAAIAAAVEAVELAGADPKLTEAVCLLGRAKDCVSDYVDKKLMNLDGLKEILGRLAHARAGCEELDEAISAWLQPHEPPAAPRAPRYTRCFEDAMLLVPAAAPVLTAQTMKAGERGAFAELRGPSGPVRSDIVLWGDGSVPERHAAAKGIPLAICIAAMRAHWNLAYGTPIKERPSPPEGPRP